MLGGICSVDGRIVSEAEARIPVDDLAFAYGYGVYENLKVRNRLLHRPKEHVERILRSAGVIGLPVRLSGEDLLAIITELAGRIGEASFNIKLMLVGERACCFASLPHYLPAKAYRDGVAAITLPGERPFPKAKTLSMLSSYLAYGKAKAQGAYDALLVDREGAIAEGTRTNLFYTRGEEVYTPPSSDVLEGVARGVTIAALRSAGVAVEERRLRADELGSFEGFFLTSTSAGLVPLSSIDGRPLSVPDVVVRARRVFEEAIERGEKVRV